MSSDKVLTLGYYTRLLGLPGSVGSIFVSRLSTALHAAALLPNMSMSLGDDSNPHLVMITLLLITIPLEVVFIATLKWFGWLHLPFIFAVFSVLFFCCAVSTYSYPYIVVGF
jgi:solute carrier family 41